MAQAGTTLAGQAGGGRVKPGHTGPHPDDPTLPAPDPLHTLLSRCCYGIRSQDWNRGTELDYTGWLTEQLNMAASEDAGVEALVAATWPRIGMSAAELLADVRATSNAQLAAGDLRAASLLRQLYCKRQLFETMVEFWSDHFNIATTASPESYYKCVDDREVIRANALGTFKTMLHASARSLAMLYYLDNVSNRNTGPNENYARELMELHTLGVDGGFTETDVSEVARCFTGWTVSGVSSGMPTFAFVSSRHDTSGKLVLGTTIPAGGGISDGNAVLDLLAGHPSTAKYIATKLCQKFIGDAPQQTAIDAVAATFTSSGGHIPSVLMTLLGSAEFISSYDRKVRRPVDYVLACLRATDATLSGNFLTGIVNRLNTLGQLPFRWPTPDGYPDDMDGWVNSGAMLNRWNWAVAVAEGKVSGVAIDLAGLSANANTAVTLVDQLASRLLHRPLSMQDRDALVGFAANGGDPAAVMVEPGLSARRREVAGLLLSSTYFNYR